MAGLFLTVLSCRDRGERILIKIHRRFEPVISRFQIENYIKTDTFSFDKTYGKYLAEYIRILNKSRKEISEDLSVHYTKLSRIINDKEEPNIELSYRLEKHSGGLIKAELWWKLIAKKQAFIISKDEDTKRIEQGKVRNYLVA